VDRIGDSRYVLIGEASHGTAEFYRLRDLVTRALIVNKGFTAVGVEADWPDAARIDVHARRRPATGPPFEPFGRFPTWMWRNREVGLFVAWLRDHNDRVAEPSRQVSFHGLDIYSLYRSRDEVLGYLDQVDPAAASVARARYSCLSPWEPDPAAYGRAVVTGRFEACEDAVVDSLTDLLRQRLAYRESDGDDYMNAAQNARVVANAEQYYRIMYRGGSDAWNLRDQHMFETVKTVQAHRGPGTKMVIWEHNSHVGDAGATEMGIRGEHNVGMLARQAFGPDAYLIGFGTDHGTVAAASTWGGPMEHKTIRPALAGSYERLCHETGIAAFVLPLRHPTTPDLRDELVEPLLERAIGVIYRPETERASHYFLASLPHQFDEYIWIDATTPVTARTQAAEPGIPETWPFGL
jgi:protein-L-isoaspartate(D-aspartate) O-methyltransferase